MSNFDIPTLHKEFIVKAMSIKSSVEKQKDNAYISKKQMNLAKDKLLGCTNKYDEIIGGINQLTQLSKSSLKKK